MRIFLTFILSLLILTSTGQKNFFGSYSYKNPIPYSDIQFDCGGSSIRFKCETNGGYSIKEFGVSWYAEGVYFPDTVKWNFHPITGVNYYQNIGILEDSVRYYYDSYLITTNDLIFRASTSQEVSPNCDGTPPTVTTCPPPYITTATTATVCGQVTSEGTGTLSAFGVCYSTSSNPTIFDNLADRDDTPFIGYNSYLSELLPSTTYYVRAYASNEFGTSYGDEYSFITQSLSLTLQVDAYKTEDASETYFNVTASTLSPYIATGIKYYSTYSTTINPPSNATETKTFASYPELESIYKNFMNYSPYYSIWAAGVNNPTSDDTITVFTYLQTTEEKTIHVGMIGDNYFKLELNGSLMVQSRYLWESSNFTYLNIFPVTLPEGNNLLTFSGIGDGTVSQALGVIILDNTKDEIFDNPVSKGYWNVLWSSNDAIGDTVKLCPAGYAYDDVNSTCFQIANLNTWTSGDGILLSIITTTENQGNITAWSVNWGDGNSDSGTTFDPYLVHFYSTSGSKTITYTVTISGNQEVITKSITL